ncbi:helix-turn-helix transcriptional regulator [uncultured Chryseobacterium sp.]|uniref:helix-turn-helix transcriptional regulator n=1 Tax=uncultured Chryseobacterium sp. TaxID=259322 RepID=UPI0025E84BD4|nr:helix-turn-helix transcriptional regulator [uncultured Chryseobacterium sp.]
MSVGTNLKKLRSKTKYSQQDIADMLNVDRLTYVNWENETTEIKSGYIPKLADIFGVKIQDLFDNNQSVQINNFENTDNSTVLGHQSIVINISDAETAKLLGEQIQELIKNLKK